MAKTKGKRTSKIGKRKRARELAERLKTTLNLDRAIPLITKTEHKKHGVEFNRAQVKFVLKRDFITTRVPCSRAFLFSDGYTDGDREYLAMQISRVWLHELKIRYAKLTAETAFLTEGANTVDGGTVDG